MDTVGRFLWENLLVFALFATIFLALLLFFFYLRCIIRNYVSKISVSSSLSASSSPSGLHKRPHNSIKKYSVDTECETETTVLMIPQHDIRMAKFHYKNEIEEDEVFEQLYEKYGNGNRKGNFFRLPKDRRDSYLKFNSVDDDLDELTDYLPKQTKNTLPFTSWRRNGQRDLYRKCSWDRKSLVKIMIRNKNGERKYHIYDPKEPFILSNGRRICMLNPTTTTSNKEILI